SGIHAERGIYCLQAAGVRQEAPLPMSIVEIAEDYIALIRKLQPKGPYNLLGWSFGGIVAHFAACLLQRKGEDVSMLAVLDTCPQVISTTALAEEIQAVDSNQGKIEQR